MYDVAIVGAGVVGSAIASDFPYLPCDTSLKN